MRRAARIVSVLGCALGACYGAPEGSLDPELARQDFALSTDSQLDKTFDVDGKAYGPGSTVDANDVLMQGDKPVYVGTQYYYTGQFHFPVGMSVGRLTASGAFDPTFNGGRLLSITAPGASFASGRAILQDGDGVIVGGAAIFSDGNRFVLARVKGDGTLDSSFGSGGIVVTNFGSSDAEQILDLARDARGRIVAAGTAHVTSDDTTQLALARYTSRGALDGSFDDDGKVLIKLPGTKRDYKSVALAIASNSESPVVAATNSDARNFVLRFKRDGELDPEFGSNGMVELGDAGGDGKLSAVTVRDDGIAYVAGSTDAHTFALFSLQKNGSLNTRFGDSGQVFTNFASTSVEAAYALVFHPALQRLYLGGSAGGQFAVAAYRLNGVLDATFHEDGKVMSDFASASSEEIRGMAINGERLVVAGTARLSGGVLHAGLARYRIDTSLQDEPCSLEGTCLENLACRTSGTSSSVSFTWCRKPSTSGGSSGGSSTGGSTGGDAEICPNEGMPCSVHPSECSSASFQVTGTYDCINRKDVCVADHGRDYCATCGGECGGCEGESCDANALCAPGLACTYDYLNDRMRCTSACSLPFGACWTADQVGSCNAGPGKEEN